MLLLASASQTLPAALDVAFTVGHDRDPAHGSAAIAPAMASSNTGISNCCGRRLARRDTCSALHGVRPLPGSQSKCDMQINQKAAFTNR